ncbi:unnamed protein product, partial [marine sediment metagenome]
SNKFISSLHSFKPDNQMPPVKILHLIQTSGPGGAETIIINLVSNIDKEKYQSTVGLLKKGWLYEQLAANGADVRIITSGGSFDFKLLYYLVKLINKERIDLVHSHLMDMNFYSSIAAKLVGIPHIATEHGDIHHVSKNSRFGLKPKAISSLSTRLVFVSRFTQEAFLKRISLDGRKTEVIYNGIDFRIFDREIDIKRKRADLGIQEHDFVVGNVGNLYPVKGQTYLLQAACRVLRRVPNVKFLVIGRGELENKLTQEAKNLKLGNHVLFLGFRGDT